MIRKELPSKEYLNSILEYREGKLYWKINKANRIKIGDLVVGLNNKYGYYQVCIDYKLYRVHSIIWKMFYGKDPEFEIDHINHDRSDNRIENLRDTNENNKNRSKYNTNTSGYSNIRIRNRKKPFLVYFGIEKYSRAFLTLEEAIQHRNEKYIEFGFHKNHGG